jgi:hypothetical protein
MNRIPAFIATATTALVLVLAPAAHADGPPDPAGPTTEFCQTVPGIWILNHQYTEDKDVCVPWPF